MALSSAAKLGPYEIITPLGAGGMGEVYRARDPRLGRDVAVKILPESFASDENRLRRFEREARAVASLNHPNILSVHDIGTHEGIHFIVTELLEGETLREKLDRGALAPRRATEYAVQIAHGLAAAHEKGIVHRDLKPENLFITKDSRVKILDFGLAKQPMALVGHDADTLTNSTPTSEGTVLGTVGYMAPEQVLGNPLDHCTDIFAFGTVLYEMLSGHYAFRRNSSVETMAAILKEDPAELLSSGEQQVPGALERIVRRCLEKSPGQRFQSAKDLSFALENMSAGTSQTQTLVAPPQNRWRKISLVLVIFAVVAIAFATRGFLARPQQPEFRRITFRKGAVSAARFAPDGESVIYAAAWENPSNMLYRSRLDGTDLRRLDMPANDLLAVSHSGELAIVSKGGTSRLARAPVNGGAPRELLDHVVAADWSPDATQLAIARYQNGKCRLEYPIGRLVYETISTISDMRLSPQGDAIAFMEHPLRGDDRGTVVLTDLKGNRRALTAEWNGEQGLAWSPDGREVWFTATSRADWERDLYAVSRSGKLRRVLRTPATPYLEDIASDGRVLLRRQDRRYEVAAGKIGGQTRLLSWLEIMLAASVSRDGNYVVIGDWSGIGGGDYDVYLAKLDGSPAVLLGSGIAGGISPDNKWVTSILPSDTTKVLLLPTGIGETKTITAPNFHYHGATWASDGHTLVVRASESDRPLRFWVQDTAGGSPRAVTPEGAEGVSVTVNHSDYISVRDAAGTIRLYPIHGGEPKTVPGVTEAEQVIGGSMDSDVVYVSANPSAIPQQILKVNVATGRRQPFVTVSPSDAAGITGLGPPIFSADENRYVYTQVRELSVLYVAAGLK